MLVADIAVEAKIYRQNKVNIITPCVARVSAATVVTP